MTVLNHTINRPRNAQEQRVFHLVCVYVFDACIQGGEQKLVLLKLVLQVGERKLRVTDALQQGDKGQGGNDRTEGKKKKSGLVRESNPGPLAP